ncbi:MAG: terpene cyclase/mutase family protein [Planctomycetaceae bacterium]|nr:terpene cyclase/mutase family protein [Planctomycetaceae bacterium]
MPCWLVAIVMCGSEILSAAEEASDAAVALAVDRGLVFLAKDAVKWKADHNCVSCHHAGMVIWAMNVARQQGHTVNGPLLDELTKWIAEAGDGRSSLPRPESAPKALNTKALWFSLALISAPETLTEAQAGLMRMLPTLRGDQTESGAWSGWPETRAPMFGPSDGSMTALAAFALIPDAKTDAASRGSLTKAVQWLDDTPPDDEWQSTVMRLAVLSRLERPQADRDRYLETIRQKQRADGGWSQNPSLPSDAWSTGQTLMALADAGVTKADPVVQRGRSFLVRTQQEHGAWPMASRPTKPSGEGAKNLIPIIGAGSAWAVIGLARHQ